MYQITERQIIGMIFQYLSEVIDGSWVGNLSMPFTSNQASEEYAWLGASPAMREWVGERLAKGLSESSLTIRNRKFESTVEILGDWLRRDQTGQIEQRIQQLAARANTHWASLLSALIVAGTATACYDGQYFFDTDHSEGDSGTQNNDITVDISGVPASVHGVVTAPSIEEMQASILTGIAAMLGFKDNQGEPMNEDARSFVVMTPVSLWMAARNAASMAYKGAGESSQMDLRDFNIQIVGNARMTTWTDEFAIFRADGANRPLIRQEETPLQVTAIAEGSELEFKEDKHQYGVWASRNVGYGFWQSACLVTMT
jgi:phage major head subunit gpT-like protein